MISTARLTMAMGFFRRRRRPSFQKLTLSRMTDRLSFSESLAGAKSSTLSCMLKICFCFPFLRSPPAYFSLIRGSMILYTMSTITFIVMMSVGQEDRGSHDDHINRGR